MDEGDKPTSYILRESIPAGVTLTDQGGGQYDSAARVLKWTVIESAYYGTVVEDRTFTYSAMSTISGTHALHMRFQEMCRRTVYIMVSAET